MKIAFYGGQTAGIIVLLTLMASKHRVMLIFPEDQDIKKIAQFFGLSIKDKLSLNDKKCLDELKKSVNLFICCHGKRILPKIFVKSLTCINLHPCLYKYKGTRPIKRLIEDKNPRASVAVHYMTENVDKGDTIVELFTTIENVGEKTEAEVYNELYPLYIESLLEALKILK